MTELKPCPFCGGQAMYVCTTSTLYNPKTSIECCQCGSSAKMHHTRLEAIEAWNRRVDGL